MNPPPSSILLTPTRDEVVARVRIIEAATAHGGRPVLAALKRDGRVRAWGRALVDHEGNAEVALRPLAGVEPVTDGWYQLWVTLDHDGLESWYPGFGDWFLIEWWNLYDATRVKPITDPQAWQERALAADPESLLTVHYHRYDGDYDNVSLWTWDGYYERTPDWNELLPVGEDAFGLIFQVDRRAYGSHGSSDRIGLVPRLAADWSRKDGDDKFWRPEHGTAIWLIGTRARVWTEAPTLEPHVAGAWIDSPLSIVVQLSRFIDPDTLAGESLQVIDDQGHARSVVRANLLAQPGRADSDRLELVVYEPLNAALRNYRVHIPGFIGDEPAIPRGVLDVGDTFSAPHARLGARYAPEATTFRVFAPTAHAVEVVLYDNSQDDRGRAALPMERAGKGIWEQTVAGDLVGRYYLYRLEGADLPGSREVVDIYAVNTVNSTRRARITDLAATDPPGWETARSGPDLASPVDMVIYEMHVRDFTIADNAGVQARGRFRGFVEGGTRLPDDRSIKTGFDHLLELGVTHVQLMPIQDFENDEARPRYDWGYMPMVWLSPDGWYASNVDDDSRIREFKQLVQALHAHGLGVILDVVCNHTSGAAPFNQLVPHYYYRMRPDGGYSNGSGCGNDFRSESLMGRKYIVDSLLYWVEECGVDGFRFDLMALLDASTMRQVERQLRRRKPDIVLYGEPWAAGATAMRGKPTDKSALRGTQLGAFNDNFRNALKGAPEGSEPGFIQAGWHRDQVKNGIEGSIHGWAPSPAHSINYLTCHDNLVLFDKLRESNPQASDEALVAMMKLGYLLLFTSQGVPFLHGGEEFARTKGGHHNSYNAPDNVNQVDWNRKRTHHDLFAYVRDLIAIRRAHPLFRLRDRKSVQAALRFHEPPTAEAIMFTLANPGLEHESWQRACVVANASDLAHLDLALPEGPWHVALDHRGAVVGEHVIEGTLRIHAKSGVILYQPLD